MHDASTHDRSLRAVLVLCLLLLSLAAADPAMSKPKKPAVSNGCTIDQIQAPSSQGCMSQLDQDVMDGVAYPHALFCDEPGVYCCQSDGTRTFGCKKVATLRFLQKILPSTLPGTIQAAPQ